MTAQPLVLAVDDEPGMLKLISMVLSSDGFRVMVAEDGPKALRLVERHHPDLIILDIRMPKMSGLEVMHRLRQRATTPVIFLTGKLEDGDKVMGLDAGADDYMPKPFNPSELTARARAVVRRAQRQAGNAAVLQSHGVEIDLDRRVVKKEGQFVRITRTEWRLLRELVRNSGRVLLIPDLLTAVWGPDYRDDVQYLRVWISRLRAKLERDPSRPKMILTFPGIGYMFRPERLPDLDGVPELEQELLTRA
jgi:two-component system KDP operon response regulator KdpE